MEFWKTIWMIALAFGFCGFSYISYRVIVRGYAETRSLLGGIGKKPDQEELKEGTRGKGRPRSVRK